jgi:hypothetical protein
VLVNEAAQLVLADALVGQHRTDLVDHELVHAQAQLLDLRRAGDTRALLQVLPP